MSDNILVLGAGGMVGSAILRILKKNGYRSILAPSRSELDLLNQQSVYDYFEKFRPTEVYLAAAKVGGIKANNTYRADFIYENLQIESNVFGAAFRTDVERFLFLGATCIYPRNSQQPIKEEYLLTGEFEPTNEPYAIAKIAGLKMAENFRRQYGKKYYTVLPTNLYGPNDNYHPENSHVIPGMLQRFYKAKQNADKSIKIWGSGNPRREFLYVDDLAEACLIVMRSEEELPYWINIGVGEDVTIRELAEKIAQVVDFHGEIEFDKSIPDGMMRKLLDISKIKSLGWSPKINLEQGLRLAYEDYLKRVQTK